MLACKSSRDDVKFVEADDTVYPLRSREIGDGTYVVDRQGLVLNGLSRAESGPGPGRVEKLLTRDQRYIPTDVMGFLQKLVSLVFAGYANDMILHKEPP